MIDPNEHKQTHDPLGREFSEPQPGGPVAEKLNLVIGACSANDQIIVSLIRDGKSIDYFVGGYADEVIDEVLEPLTKRLEPYEADLAYYDWFEAYVGDVAFEDAREEVESLLDGAGLVYESA